MIRLYLRSVILSSIKGKINHQLQENNFHFLVWAFQGPKIIWVGLNSIQPSKLLGTKPGTDLNLIRLISCNSANGSCVESLPRTSRNVKLDTSKSDQRLDRRLSPDASGCGQGKPSPTPTTNYISSQLWLASAQGRAIKADTYQNELESSVRAEARDPRADYKTSVT